MAEGSRRYHHGDLRGALIETAIATLDLSPDAEITLRGLAKEVGVSPMAPYAHFDDKDALLDAIAVEGFRALSTCMREALRALPDSAALDKALSALAAAYVDFGLKRPGLYRVMFARPAAPQGTVVRDAGEDVFAELVKQFSGSGQNARRDAELAWSMVHGLTLLVGTGFIKEGPDLDHHVVEIGQLLSINPMG
ncbi:TetR/AcrR family transcriptional regulator [Ahrensia marina]|uniref:TetR/AcrR family transcriptional regulator n=1 Tax=Ahrensia marina TaxID=1514904 RepID=UPI0035D01292